MKVWNGYGTEHSARLVMIGKFESVEDATEAKRKLDILMGQAQKDIDNGHISMGRNTTTYSDEMLQTLMNINYGSLYSGEVEQFVYEVSINQDGDTIRFDTDEVDISAFLKLLIHEGAKVEIFSRHDYPEDE